jgi:hypothetical protein
MILMVHAYKACVDMHASRAEPNYLLSTKKRVKVLHATILNVRLARD